MGVAFAMLNEMHRLRLAILILSLCVSAELCGQSSSRERGSHDVKPSLPRRNVTLQPAFVESGSPELIRVEAPGATNIDGEWLGHPVLFFPAIDHQAWFAIAGVDVEAQPGPSTLKITVHMSGGVQDVSAPVEIHAAHYRTGSLSVAPKFVEPDAEAMKEITVESELKKKVFAHSADSRLWTGSFLAPVKAPPTDSFGTRRMFNGKLASVHKGMDFRAPSGTPVMAGNAGTVVLAQLLYYEGNCVIIDHGLGLMSYSMHLSRIDVKVGDTVAKGQRLGLSGATGRVTGPHLHWAIRWEGAMLDPAKLLQLKLDDLR